MVLTTSPNGTDRQSGAGAFRDRWQERQGITSHDPKDPMAALRPANASTVTVQHRPIVADPEPEPDDKPTAPADFTNDAGLVFGKINWFTRGVRQPTAGQLLLTLPLKMDVVRLSKTLRTAFGDGAHVLAGFARDDLFVIHLVGSADAAPNSLYVRPQGEVGGQALLDEFARRGWRTGRYEVTRVGPNLWTCAKAKRVADAMPGNNVGRKKSGGGAHVVKVAPATGSR